MMARSLETAFDQKLQQMPKEVSMANMLSRICNGFTTNRSLRSTHQPGVGECPRQREVSINTICSGLCMGAFEVPL